MPQVVRADEKRLRQILINLVGNAIKFTTQGHVILRVRYALQMAQIDIEDTGPGMARGEIDKVFEPFARGASASQANAAPGAGLGLTIAKMLTDLMGGELTVQSAVGEGTSFRVRLFLPEVHGAAALRAAPPQPRRGYEGPRHSILVVDNEEPDRELLVQLLQPLGFELRTAASGHDALDLLAAGVVPDVILMDLAMPGIDGWETLRRIRRMPHINPKVAIVSANAFDKGLDNGLGVAAQDFILKPVRHGELLDWLQGQLDLRWTAQPVLAPAPPALVQALVAPDAATLAGLRALVQLGFYRGIVNRLDEIEAAQPECVSFCAPLRVQARAFQFEAMARYLDAAEQENAV